MFIALLLFVVYYTECLKIETMIICLLFTNELLIQILLILQLIATVDRFLLPT